MIENKDDLISRSELKKAFNKWWCCDDIPTNVVEDIIDNAPTVEIPNYGGQVMPDTLQGWRYEWYITPDRQITIEEYMQSLKGEN